MNEVAASENKEVPWGRPLLIAGGIVWIIRAGLELIFQPEYWSPQSAVDYAAVAGTSLSFMLLALGLWAIHLSRRPQGRLRKWGWLVGVVLAAGGALVAGVANFIEDWLAIKALGDFFFFGSLALFVGLLLAGISTIRAADVSPWTGWLLIACALGLGTIDSGGGFIVGTSLILLGILQGN